MFCTTGARVSPMTVQNAKVYYRFMGEICARLQKKHFSSDQQFKGEICPSDRFAGTFGNFLCSSAGAGVSTKGCGEFHTSIGGREMKFCLFEVFGAADRGGRKWKGRASAHSSSKMSVCEREKGGVEGHAQGKPIRVRIYFREAENR